MIKSIINVNYITIDLIDFYRNNTELAIRDYYLITNNDRGLRKLDEEVYYEIHHKIPKCMGGSNNSDNLVKLTFEEHLKAHLLLHLIYPFNEKLTYSLSLMLSIKKSKNGKFLDTLEIDIDYLSNLRKEHNKNISNRLRGKPKPPMSEETKKKLSIANTGKHLTKETREKISKANRKENNPFYGKHHTEETKEKLSQSSRISSLGRRHTEETKQKLSEINTGKHLTEETKKKLSITNTGKHLTKETREKISKANRKENNPFYGKHHTEEAKKKLSESHMGSKNVNYGKHFSEEHKRKISESNGIKVMDSDGNIFSSITDAGKYHKVNRKTIRNWIDKHPEKGFKFVK